MEGQDQDPGGSSSLRRVRLFFNELIKQEEIDAYMKANESDDEKARCSKCTNGTELCRECSTKRSGRRASRKMKFTDILYTERLELKVQDLSKEVSTLHAQNDLLEKNSGHVSELEKRIAVLEETNKQQAMQVEVLRGIIERPAEVHTSKRMPRVISNSIRINRCCSRTNATRICSLASTATTTRHLTVTHKKRTMDSVPVHMQT